MTFRDILAEIYSDLKYGEGGQPPDEGTTTRIRRYVNSTHRQLLSRPGMSGLRDTTFSFASVANQARYGLPPGLGRINRIWETTNDETLRSMTLHEYRLADPDPQAGTPEAFVFFNRNLVAIQPSDASSVYVKSTSSSDTGVLAYVEGLITGGYRRSNGSGVVMTGTTGVDVASTISTWIDITSFTLSGTAFGTVTLHEDSGSGTELARIEIGYTSAPTFALILWPTPSAVVTYYIDGTRDIPELVQDADVPLVPEDFHDLLVAGAKVRAYEYTDDPRREMAQLLYDRRLNDLAFWLHSGASATFQQGRAEALAQRRNNLGPWYPAGGRW